MAQELRIDVPQKAVEMAKAEEKNKLEKHCIYKLPACVTDLNKKAYKPRCVSFGPYHHDDPKLKPMEPHKSRVVVRFLERSGKSMPECIKALSDNGVDEQLRDAYDSLDPKWRRKKRQEFLSMMVEDGCFVLEILRYSMRYHRALVLGPGEGTAPYEFFKTQYNGNDPIFSEFGALNMIPYITRDMLMLENQLPLLLLKELLTFEGLPETKQDDAAVKLIVDFYKEGKFNYEEQKNELQKCKHILEIYRKVFIGGDDDAKMPHPSASSSRDISRYDYDFGENILPSASRLLECGIKIHKTDEGRIKDIKFHPSFLGGVLEIPVIVVDDTTESKFLNMMAFERFHPGVRNDVTSYIGFMDDIIDNDKDVKILQKYGIVSNAYGSDMAVATLFNSLSKDTTLDMTNRLVHVRYAAKQRCKRTLNKRLGELWGTYFVNPWTVIALFAAIFAFLIGTTDTIFSILGNT